MPFLNPQKLTDTNTELSGINTELNENNASLTNTNKTLNDEAIRIKNEIIKANKDKDALNTELKELENRKENLQFWLVQELSCTALHNGFLGVGIRNPKIPLHTDSAMLVGAPCLRLRRWCFWHIWYCI